MSWLTDLYEPPGGNADPTQMGDYLGNGRYGRKPAAIGGGTAPATPVKPQSLLDRFEAGTEEANKANEARYQQALGVRYRLRDYVRSLLEGSGKSAMDDATAASNSRVAGAENSLMSRGLYNTTLTDSMRRSEGFNLAREKARIGEDTAGHRAQMEALLGGGIADTIERKQDLGPSADIYAAAMGDQERARAARRSQSGDMFSNILGTGAKLLPLLF